MTNSENTRLFFTCPCCGFVGLDLRPYANASGIGLIRGLTPPYENHFGTATYEVCACCWFEFGNDDNPGTAPPMSFEAYLLQWIAVDLIWMDASKKPENWSLRDQLYSAAMEVE